MYNSKPRWDDRRTISKLTVDGKKQDVQFIRLVSNTPEKHHSYCIDIRNHVGKDPVPRIQQSLSRWYDNLEYETTTHAT